MRQRPVAIAMRMPCRTTIGLTVSQRSLSVRYTFLLLSQRIE